MYKCLPENHKRNFELTKVVLDKRMSQTSAAIYYGVSRSRVSQIIWQTCYDVDPVFIGSLRNNKSRNLKRLQPKWDELLEKVRDRGRP